MLLLKGPQLEGNRLVVGRSSQWWSWPRQAAQAGDLNRRKAGARLSVTFARLLSRVIEKVWEFLSDWKRPVGLRVWKPSDSYLVDPASSHMLVSKIKPCKCKYELLYSETANGSLNQLWFIWLYAFTWITVAILELIHA